MSNMKIVIFVIKMLRYFRCHMLNDLSKADKDLSIMKEEWEK